MASSSMSSNSFFIFNTQGSTSISSLILIYSCLICVDDHILTNDIYENSPAVIHDLLHNFIVTTAIAQVHPFTKIISRFSCEPTDRRNWFYYLDHWPYETGKYFDQCFGLIFCQLSIINLATWCRIKLWLPAVPNAIFLSISSCYWK